MGRPRRLRRGHRAPARRRSSPTRRARRRSRRDRARSPVLPAAERRLAVPLGEEPASRCRRASSSRRYDDAAWDTLPVPSNWQVVGANEGRPYDRPFFTNIKHPFKADPPRVPARRQPRRALPDALRGAGRLEGPQRLRALRGRAVGLLRVAERAEARLSRGRVHAGRVRPDAAPAAGDERARGRGDPPLGRQLPRGPGLLAPRRDLPRRVPRSRSRRCACATSRCAPTSTPPTATRRSSCARPSRTGRGRRPRATTWSASVLDAARRRGLLARSSRRRRRDRRGRARPRSTASGLVRAPRLWSAETPNLYTLVLEHRDAAGAVAGGRRARASASARWRSRAGSCC